MAHIKAGERMIKNHNEERADVAMEDVEGSTGAESLRSKQARQFSKILVKEGIENSRSFSLGTTTVEMQAKNEGDFLGADVDYYDFGYKEVRDHIDGEYVIVWSKDHGKNGGEGTPALLSRAFLESLFTTHTNAYLIVKLYNLTVDHRIDVYPKKLYPHIKRVVDICRRDYFAAVVVRSGDKALSLGFDNHKTFEHTAAATVLQRNNDNGDASTNIIQEIIPVKSLTRGSTAVFGIKKVGTCSHATDNRSYSVETVTLGFEFMKLSLLYYNSRSDKNAFLDIVAVKIPNEGDVASAYLLKQKLFKLPPSYWLLREVNAKEYGIEGCEDGECEDSMLLL